MGTYNICFNADNNYVEQIGVAIASILRNSDKEEKFHFHILDGGFSEESKKQIQSLIEIKDFKIDYIKMNPKDFKDCPLLKDYNPDFKHFHVPLSGYYRFKMASIFPKLDKILYLDCDIVVTGSLKDLYKVDVSASYAAMVPDVESENESERLDIPIYCNAGVMLINLKKWREDNIEALLFEYAKNNKEKILWQDQDVLNVVLKEGIKTIPRKWNFQFFQYDQSRYEGLYEKYHEFKIIHFAGRFKPWTLETTHPLFQEYYDYLRLTPWKNKLAEYKKNAFEKFFAESPSNRAFFVELEDIKNQLESKLEEKIEKFNKSLEVLNNEEFSEKIAEVDENRQRIQENKNALSNLLELQSKSVKDLSQRLVDVESKLFSHCEATIQEILKNLENTESHLNFLSEERSQSAIDKILSVEAQLYKHIEERKEDTVQKVLKIEKDLYTYNEEIRQGIINRVTEVEANLYQHNDQKIKGVDERISDVESKLYNHSSQRIKELKEEFAGVESKLYELNSATNSQMYEHLERLENKINVIDKESKLDINEQKEFLNRLIQTKTENLKSFFEEAIKTQLAILSKSYDDSIENQKRFYEEQLKRSRSFHQEALETQILNQKSWYENEIQKQVNEVYSQNNAILNTKLEEQKESYVKEINSQKDLYETSLQELRQKLGEAQIRINALGQEAYILSDDKIKLENNINECQNYIKNLENEKDSLAGALEEYRQKASEIEQSNIQLSREIAVLKAEVEEKINRIGDLESEIAINKEDFKVQLEKIINEYETKMKPFSGVIDFIEARKGSKKKQK